MSNEKLLNGFVSNTVAGTGNNFVLFLKKSEKHTYLSFLKTIYSGSFRWKFWYSNTVDSTFDNGSEAYADRSGGNFTVESAFIGLADKADSDRIRSKTLITYNGKKTKRVVPDEKFWSDEIEFSVSQGEYLVFGWTVVAEDDITVIPLSPDSQIPCFVSDDGNVFYETLNALKPNLFAVKKDDVKQLGFLGDSITQGCGTRIDKYEFWAARIGYALKERYSSWNLGLGFARAKDAAKKGAWFYKACQCDEIVICLGINEILGNPEDDDFDILKSLDTIIGGLKENNSNVKITLFTLPPPNDPESRIEIWRKVNLGIRNSLANKADSVFDMARVLGNFNGIDYLSVCKDLHPDGIGGKITAEAFLSQYFGETEKKG